MIKGHTDLEHHEHKHHCAMKCISWTAVIAGALVGVGLSFLLNLFSIAIGLTAFTTTPEGLATLAIGGFIGLLIGAIVSMFVAGWVAGYLGRPFCLNNHVGSLYGFVTWCVALIITVLLTSHMGLFISTHYQALNNPQTGIMHATTDAEAPMVSRQMRTSEGTSLTTTRVTVNEEKAANAIGKSLFLTFVLFFFSAIACCLGGYYGIARCAKEDSNRTTLN